MSADAPAVSAPSTMPPQQQAHLDPMHGNGPRTGGVKVAALDGFEDAALPPRRAQRCRIRSPVHRCTAPPPHRRDDGGGTPILLEDGRTDRRPRVLTGERG